jgi:thymidylate synthase (FAD)
MQELVDAAQKLYREMEDFGVAKEQCRVILPLCLETTFIWTGSFLAFVHLCNLRLKPDAQKETQMVVAEMLRLVKEIEGNPFKHTIAAFNL